MELRNRGSIPGISRTQQLQSTLGHASGARREVVGSRQRWNHQLWEGIFTKKIPAMKWKDWKNIDSSLRRLFLR